MGGNWVAPLLDTGTCKLTIGLSVVAVYSRGNVTVHFQENAFSFCRRLYRRSNCDGCVVAWQHETHTADDEDVVLRPTDRSVCRTVDQIFEKCDPSFCHKAKISSNTSSYSYCTVCVNHSSEYMTGLSGCLCV